MDDYLVACDEKWYQACRDLDEDGQITTEQLKEVIKGYDPMGELNRACEIIMIMKESTLDQNDRIAYEEFLLNMHPNFEETQDWIPNTFKKMKSMAPWIDPSKDSDGTGDDDDYIRSRCRCGKRSRKGKKKKGCNYDNGK